MRFRLASVLVIIAALLGQARLASQSSDVTSALQQRYSDWMTAFRQSDGATLDKMEASGLTLVFEDGAIWTKRVPRVEELKGRPPVPISFKIEKATARVHGDVAVLTGVQIDSNTKTRASESATFTTVWKREGGDWKIWSAHWSIATPTKK